MKKFDRILATLVVAAIVTFAFIACNKDNKTNLNTGDNTIIKTPIALSDNTTDRIEYFIDFNKLQTALNKYSALKDETDRYIIGAWEIEFDGETSMPILKYTVLDTEDESSYTIYLIDFIDSSDNGENTSYYIKDEMYSGFYSYYISPYEGKYYIVNVENGINFYVTSWDDNSKQAPGGASGLTCHSNGCKDSETECRAVKNSTNSGFKCSECEKPGNCNWDDSPGLAVYLTNSMR